MLFSLKFAVLALASVAAAQSSSTSAEASGSSSSTAVVTASSSTSSSASSTSATSSVNATSSGAVPLPSGSNLTPCIINCVMKAAEENGCGSFTNLTCVCTSKPFQTAAASCLKANCTSTDVNAANSLQMTQCAAIVGSSGASSMPPKTLSNTASGSSTPITPASTGASSTAPAASTTNGAQLFAANGIWALVAGLMGITAAAL